MNSAMKNLPNILTGSRLVMALFMFVALAAAAGAVPYLSETLTADSSCGWSAGRSTPSSSPR
jgi:phosphatidylglycerophosphate synthase